MFPVHHCEYTLKHTELYTFKWLQWSVLCVFHHNKKKSKYPASPEIAEDLQTGPPVLHGNNQLELRSPVPLKALQVTNVSPGHFTHWHYQMAPEGICVLDL